MLSAIVFAFTFWLATVNADLPKDISKCHAGDSECIKNIANEIIRRFPMGNAEFGLQRLDELNIDDFRLSTADESSLMQIHVKCKKATFYGFENVTVTRADGFFKDLKNLMFNLTITAPHVLGKGVYEASGKILLLPVNGFGNAVLDFYDSEVTLQLKMKYELRGDKHYLKVERVKTDVKTSLLHFNLENIFKGNKEISDALNLTINENWQELWNLVYSDIKHMISRLMENYLSSIFDNLPYEDFYKED